jgi:DNA-binding transcriptional regulator YhcF (GntR family)
MSSRQEGGDAIIRAATSSRKSGVARMFDSAEPRATNGASTNQTRLSYKFQRLREQLRNAIVGGEFQSRLPGERELGKRYKANAKTINKALCDLTSEGLLVRQIGRGTFVANGAEHARTGGQFICFRPQIQSKELYRDGLVDNVGRLLTDQSHQLEVIQTGNAHDIGRIPVSAWAQANRSTTRGVMFQPHEPLSGGAGRPEDALLAELSRRRVPSVTLGAAAFGAKTHSVCPDYTDAGFRLAEHLILSGCTRIVMVCSAHAAREIELIWNGAWVAAGRHKIELVRHILSPDKHVGELIKSVDAQSTGLLTVGGAATRAVLATGATSDDRADARVRLTCILEPGETAASEWNVTSYDVEPALLAAWAARLLTESQPADRPTEVLVPGTLIPRGDASFKGTKRSRLHEGDIAALEEVKI